LQLSWQPSDPRYHLPGSGWYWEIRQAGTVQAHSKSLGNKSLSIVPEYKKERLSEIKNNRLVLAELHESGSLQIQQFTGPDRKLLQGQLLEINLPQTDKAFLYVVTGPISEIEHDVQQFIFQVAIGFLLLFLGLLIAIKTQVRISLRPLRAMQNAINDIHQGKIKKLPNDFPDEVQVVVNELNALLDHTDNLLTRSRLSLGNLAHGIKNPLTVIRNEAKQVFGESSEVILDQTRVISANLDHQLAQARTAATVDLLGSRSNVEEIVEGIRFVLERLYQDSNINIHTSDLKDRWFRGEEQDLEEMVGNLMDNACKWTIDQIWVHAEKDGNRLRLIIEDNGPGIPKNKMSAVFQRGLKLDETIPGQGLGLHIVDDIVKLYDGSLILERSSHGGLCAILELPLAIS
ncbi:MAG: GHKL domain-containing protein, partial [Methylococcales bacterium]|nr:GHKL domain-containing protein [Methylococcales bacterium]